MATDPELVERARTLRSAGLSIEQIATRLDLRSRSTVRRWVRDLPVPAGLRERAAHAHRINGVRWTRDRDRRETERAEVKRSAAARVGVLSDRELMLVGAALYWAEGSKDKPWSRRENVVLINSDATVLLLFLRRLDLMGVSEDCRGYRVSIHETADLEAAHRYWSDVIGVPIERFARPTIKRHQPKTVRHNTGDGYHGCLSVSVRQSRILYQQIDGLWRGMVAAAQRHVGTSEEGTD